MIEFLTYMYNVGQDNWESWSMWIFDQFSYVGNRARYRFIELDILTGLNEQMDLGKPYLICPYWARIVKDREKKDSHFSGETNRMLSSSISITTMSIKIFDPNCSRSTDQSISTYLAWVLVTAQGLNGPSSVYVNRS